MGGRELKFVKLQFPAGVAASEGEQLQKDEEQRTDEAERQRASADSERVWHFLTSEHRLCRERNNIRLWETRLFLKRFWGVRPDSSTTDKAFNYAFTRRFDSYTFTNKA